MPPPPPRVPPRASRPAQPSPRGPPRAADPRARPSGAGAVGGRAARFGRSAFGPRPGGSGASRKPAAASGPRALGPRGAFGPLQRANSMGLRGKAGARAVRPARRSRRAGARGLLSGPAAAGLLLRRGSPCGGFTNHVFIGLLQVTQLPCSHERPSQPPSISPTLRHSHQRLRQ